MKKDYYKPLTRVLTISPSQLLQGSNVYTDDPKHPGSALSRRRHPDWEDWDDDEDE